VKPSAELIYYTQVNPDSIGKGGVVDEFGLREPCDLIEFAGRWDYGPKSANKMGDRAIITRWLNSGEESMIEMVDAAFFIVCSRVVSHELVRHRIASFQQESQRFVAYEDEDPEDLFYIPSEYEGTMQGDILETAYGNSLKSYIMAGNEGVPKQLRRYVLPNAMRTRIIMKANLREWRHILKLRMHKSAQPEMRELMEQIHDQLLATFPDIFRDIKPWLEAGERAAR